MNTSMTQDKTTTLGEHETIRLAQDFTLRLRQGDVVALCGPLGAGKSVFARSVVRTLMDAPDLIVPSPTFTLVQTYEAPYAMIWHFDLYRLKNPEEVWELGWEEACTNGIVLIEWPHHAGSYLPDKRWEVTLEFIDQDTRYVSIALL